MPRIARIVIEGVAHHVVQRGNNRQDVFFVDGDYGAYLRILEEQGRAYGLEALGYCLMTNHVHLVAVPARSDSLAKAVGRTDFVYTRYVNRLHGRSGHLWQNRFYSCGLDEEHVLLAMRYVEQNPVRAGVARLAWGYRWSSAGAHTGAVPADGLLDMGKWREIMDAETWRAALGRMPAKTELSHLRRCAQRGWPLAGDSFLARLEKRLNRRLRPLSVGRPAGVKDRRRRKRRQARAGELK